MFSITPSELLTIAVIALIVFGPRRLAEVARRAGEITGELKRTADELRSGIQEELEEAVGPMRETKTQLAAAGKELVETAQGELKWVDKPDTAGSVGEGAPAAQLAEDQPSETANAEDQPSETADPSSPCSGTSTSCGGGSSSLPWPW